MVNIKIITRRGKRYFVALEKNKIISRRKYSGSGLNKQSAINLYTRNNTFFPDRKRRREKLRRLSQYEEYKSYKNKSFDSTIKEKIKFVNIRKNLQYYFKLTLKNGDVVSASTKPYNNPSKREKEKMRSIALDNVLKRLSKYYNSGSYDAHEGIELFDNVRKVEEGFKWYRD